MHGEPSAPTTILLSRDGAPASFLSTMTYTTGCAPQRCGYKRHASRRARRPRGSSPRQPRATCERGRTCARERGWAVGERGEGAPFADPGTAQAALVVGSPVNHAEVVRRDRGFSRGRARRRLGRRMGLAQRDRRGDAVGPPRLGAWSRRGLAPLGRLRSGRGYGSLKVANPLPQLRARTRGLRPCPTFWGSASLRVPGRALSLETERTSA